MTTLSGRWRITSPEGEAVKRAWFRFLHQLGWYPGPGWCERIGLLRRCSYCGLVSTSASEALEHYKQTHDRWLARKEQT